MNKNSPWLLQRRKENDKREKCVEFAAPSSSGDRAQNRTEIQTGKPPGCHGCNDGGRRSWTTSRLFFAAIDRCYSDILIPTLPWKWKGNKIRFDLLDQVVTHLPINSKHLGLIRSVHLIKKTRRRTFIQKSILKMTISGIILHKNLKNLNRLQEPNRN